MRQRITDLIDITQEELDLIKSKLINDERIILYSDEKLEIILHKYGRKIYEFIFKHGDKPFTDCFKDIVEIRYNP